LSRCARKGGVTGIQSDLKTWAEDLTKNIAKIRGDIGGTRVQTEQWFEGLQRTDKISGSARNE
jgi:hypothetical protein